MTFSNLTISEKFFNAAAILSLLVSIAIWFTGERDTAIFIGLWVPSIIGWMNFFQHKERAMERKSSQPL